METIKLTQVTHPDAAAQARFDALVGVDQQKGDLLDELELLFERGRLDAWHRQHHRRGLELVDAIARRSPLILFTGDVGCGKTELALTVATPLANRLDRQVAVFEAPGDVRGFGRVGEISARLTAVFDQAKRHVRGRSVGILVLDEADDLATARAQMQAHHEDRAGVNVLIKQIDGLEHEKVPLVTFLITNRTGALDPAVRRRASLQLQFLRPDRDAVRALLERLVGEALTPIDLEMVVTEAFARPVLYTYSDLTHRVGRMAVLKAYRDGGPLLRRHLTESMAALEPSPAIDSERGLE
jgi:AAA+ superfamily predicted ATPase